jgi:hypothetical protein
LPSLLRQPRPRPRRCGARSRCRCGGPRERPSLADGRHRLPLGRARADPFVKVGDKVKAGQTLLIIEAMKVMNPITATAAGTVQQILIENAQPVEFDQPLIVVG